MAGLGQSIYPTLGLEQAERHLDAAVRMGCRHLLTSLHLPEATVDDWAAVRQMLEKASLAGMTVAADVSRASLAAFGASVDDLTPFARLGVDTLRLDHGFTAAELERILRSRDFSFQINAGTTTPDDLLAWERVGIELERLTAVHNFYPRPETGISLAFYRRQNELFHRCGMKTAGFIPSLAEPRGPMFAGLPTIEAHRGMPAAVAAAELLEGGSTDLVYFGDPAPSEADWAAVRHIADGTIPLRVRWLAPPPEELKPLLAAVHHNPWDGAERVIRSPLARPFAQERGIRLAPRNTHDRPAGTVTMDNTLYGRYAGELQITRVDLPADNRVNVLGRVVAEDRALLPHISSGTSFAFFEA